jgi:hypothetical protein
MRTSDAAMHTSPSHVYYPWQAFQRWRLQSPEGPLYQGTATQDARSIKFFQDRPLPCPKHVGATATIFVAAQPTGTSPERTTDGCCYYHFKTSFKPDGKCGPGGGSADPARTSTEGAAPTTPPGGVIDRMRHWSIVGSVGPLHGPGRQWSHASAAVPRTRTSLGRQRVILGRAAGERSGGAGGRTRCVLLTRYAFGDNTIGSRGFTAAVTRTAGPRPFGGSGPVIGPVAGRA